LTSYHITLTDTERALIEQQAFNFRAATGYAMKLPPALFDDLRAGGVDMKNIEPDPSLEHVSPHDVPEPPPTH
jgi:hypothetical protein